ncbi:hypothetical protein AB0H34_35365 [Saccharopolyspora shandongensis]|uniref:hypothetical protein n=1 Tax=Saccharopolyspora shandongensis TaxID=418495 RepID=UPI0033BFC709
MQAGHLELLYSNPLDRETHDTLVIGYDIGHVPANRQAVDCVGKLQDGPVDHRSQIMTAMIRPARQLDARLA